MHEQRWELQVSDLCKISRCGMWGTSFKIARLMWGKRSFKNRDSNDLGVSKSEGGRSSKNCSFRMISVYSMMDSNDLRVSKSEGGRSSKFIMLQTEIV